MGPCETKHRVASYPGGRHGRIRPTVSSFATAVALFAGFHVLGLGLALGLRAAADLPPRYLGFLTTASTALLSYGVFYVAVTTPSMRSVTLVTIAALMAVSVLATAAALRTRAARATLAAPTVWMPPLLAGIVAAIYLWPVLAVGPPINARVAWTLPPDNILPGLFAHRTVTAVGPERTGPLLGPGSDPASERPPLQAAVVVTHRLDGPWQPPTSTTILAAFCQVQWLPALWLVGAACGLSRRTLAVVLVACAVSGFFFVNTIYTWPKLFAAALMLGALALALERPADTRRAARVRVVLVAALCALSLLAHPGSLFTLIAVPVCWPLLRRVVTLRATAGTAASGVLAAALLFAPWLAYQAVVDPPSGRLVREHLGDGRTDGSVAQTVLRANVERPFGEHVRVRAGNLAAQLGNPLVAIWPRSVGARPARAVFPSRRVTGSAARSAWRRSSSGLVRAAPDDPVRRLGLVGARGPGAVERPGLLARPGGDPSRQPGHHRAAVLRRRLRPDAAPGAADVEPVRRCTRRAGVLIWFLPIWRGPWTAG